MYSICPMQLGTDKVFLIVAPDNQTTGQYFTDENVARAKVGALNTKPVIQDIVRDGENRLFSTRG